MAAIDFKLIKRLSASTGVGVTEAKKALEVAQGDFDKAFDAMRAKGLAKAEKRVERVTKSGLIDAYMHSGRIGALVEVHCETDFVARTDEFKQFVHDLCLQVAANAPKYIERSQIPAAELKKEQELEKAALSSEGKPAGVIDKILSGKLEKYFQSVCLLDQPYIKNPEVSIQSLLDELSAKLGEKIVVSRFQRLEMGLES